MNEQQCKKLTTFMLEVGYRPNMNGFTYIRDAVIETFKGAGLSMSYITDIYNKIATKYSTTRGAVERAIRHATEIASRGQNFYRAWYNIFHANVVTPGEILTNKMVIGLFVEAIRNNK